MLEITDILVLISKKSAYFYFRKEMTYNGRSCFESGEYRE